MFVGLKAYQIFLNIFHTLAFSHDCGIHFQPEYVVHDDHDHNDHDHDGDHIHHHPKDGMGPRSGGCGHSGKWLWVPE